MLLFSTSKLCHVRQCLQYFKHNYNKLLNCLQSGPALHCRVHNSISISRESSLSVSGCWVWSERAGQDVQT